MNCYGLCVSRPPFLRFTWAASPAASANRSVRCQITKAFDEIILNL